MTTINKPKVSKISDKTKITDKTKVSEEDLNIYQKKNRQRTYFRCS
jgi:hypothetical protein